MTRIMVFLKIIIRIQLLCGVLLAPSLLYAPSLIKQNAYGNDVAFVRNANSGSIGTNSSIERSPSSSSIGTNSSSDTLPAGSKNTSSSSSTDFPSVTAQTWHVNEFSYKPKSALFRGEVSLETLKPHAYDTKDVPRYLVLCPKTMTEHYFKQNTFAHDKSEFAGITSARDACRRTGSHVPQTEWAPTYDLMTKQWLEGDAPLIQGTHAREEGHQDYRTWQLNKEKVYATLLAQARPSAIGPQDYQASKGRVLKGELFCSDASAQLGAFCFNDKKVHCFPLTIDGEKDANAASKHALCKGKHPTDCPVWNYKTREWIAGDDNQVRGVPQAKPTN